MKQSWSFIGQLKRLIHLKLNRPSIKQCSRKSCLKLYFWVESSQNIQLKLNVKMAKWTPFRNRQLVTSSFHSDESNWFPRRRFKLVSPPPKIFHYLEWNKFILISKELVEWVWELLSGKLRSLAPPKSIVSTSAFHSDEGNEFFKRQIEKLSQQNLNCLDEKLGWWYLMNLSGKLPN